MSACDAEMCPNWAGFGCVCDALDLDRPESVEDDEEFCPTCFAGVESAQHHRDPRCGGAA